VKDIVICSRYAPVVCMFVGLAISMRSFAAHPLQTEDTGTQGVGNVEWENGLSWARSNGGTDVTYQPQISYGLTPTVDLIVQPSWLWTRGEDGNRLSGSGDTNLDAKWRFFGVDPWSLGVRAGIALPTSEHGLGLAHGSTSEHAVLVATFDSAPYTVHANLGVARSPANSGQRQTIGLASTAVMWAVSEKLILTGEIATSSGPDKDRDPWMRTYLAGIICTLRPGLDLDMGLQIVTRAAVPARNWLAGLTYRFAP
jgi:hypothetical protein